MILHAFSSSQIRLYSSSRLQLLRSNDLTSINDEELKMEGDPIGKRAIFIGALIGGKKKKTRQAKKNSSLPGVEPGIF